MPFAGDHADTPGVPSNTSANAAVPYLIERIAGDNFGVMGGYCSLFVLSLHSERGLLIPKMYVFVRQCDRGKSDFNLWVTVNCVNRLKKNFFDAAIYIRIC
mmetsp:Transcript_29796/g.43723  ORF Transcript_29796/g.43723 Transcript_29796/m.43723 type:complete len:101 (-) Transcript_29796:3322-3624(-)